MKKALIQTVSVVLLSISSTACSQSSSLLATLSPEVKENSAISFYVPPSFPEAAAKNCEAGAVLLEYDVAYSGEVKKDSVRVLADAGSSALADAAVEAVKRWTYEPAIKDGALLERNNMRTSVNFEIDGCDPAQVN